MHSVFFPRRQMRGFNWELICIYELLFSQCVLYEMHIYDFMHIVYNEHTECAMHCTMYKNCNEGKHCFVYIRFVNDMIVSNGETVAMWKTQITMKNLSNKNISRYLLFQNPIRTVATSGTICMQRYLGNLSTQPLSHSVWMYL